jgi:hypothetical protein
MESSLLLVASASTNVVAIHVFGHGALLCSRRRDPFTQMKGHLQHLSMPVPFDRFLGDMRRA